VHRYRSSCLHLPQAFLSGISRGPGGSKETGLREAQVTSLSNDDVVLNGKVEQFVAGHQLLGDDSIVGRWSGIAGGMVVGENYGGRTQAGCDLAKMGREVANGLERVGPVYIWGVQLSGGFVYASDMINGIWKLGPAPLLGLMTEADVLHCWRDGYGEGGRHRAPVPQPRSGCARA
jgi:hypothetical protein